MVLSSQAETVAEHDHTEFIAAAYGLRDRSFLWRRRGNGFDLAVSATRVENLRETIAAVEGLGARAAAVALDLRVPTSIDAAVAEVVRALGRIEVLVNNAGANLRALAVDVTREQWDDVIGTNLTGTFFLTQRVGQHLIAGGHRRISGLRVVQLG